MIISSIVSVLLLWSGDFKARLQFSGPLKSEIKGEFIDSTSTDNPLQSDRSCDVYARFEEVQLKEKIQLEKFIKVQFRFVCSQNAQPSKEIKLAPEVIRLADLKAHSPTVFISEKFKKNNFKIEDYSVEVTKKLPKPLPKTSM